MGDASVSAGVTVASLLASSGYSDVEVSAAKGIAVTAAAGKGAGNFLPTARLGPLSVRSLLLPRCC